MNRCDDQIKQKVSNQIEPTISRSREDGRHDLFEMGDKIVQATTAQCCAAVFKHLKKKKCLSTYRYVKTRQKKTFLSKIFFSKQNPAGRGAADLAVGPPM